MRKRVYVSSVSIGAVSWESRESREYFSHGINKVTWSDVGLAAMFAAESFLKIDEVRRGSVVYVTSN